jgi:hypothetical protein
VIDFVVACPLSVGWLVPCPLSVGLESIVDVAKVFDVPKQQQQAAVIDFVVGFVLVGHVVPCPLSVELESIVDVAKVFDVPKQQQQQQAAGIDFVLGLLLVVFWLAHVVAWPFSVVLESILHVEEVLEVEELVWLLVKEAALEAALVEEDAPVVVAFVFPWLFLGLALSQQ